MDLMEWILVAAVLDGPVVASYIYYGENLEMKLSEYLHSKCAVKGKYISKPEQKNK